MAKVVIPVEQLPPPNLNGDHVVQFRVVSQDRNRISEWSPLYVIKSIGQYMPYPADDISIIIDSSGMDITWDTPTIYNYSASIASASISHNHSENFKQHSTDIFIQWGSGSASMENFEYHDRILNDSTRILFPSSNPTHFRVIGMISTYGIKTGISGTEELNEIIEKISPLFKVFDTGINEI